MMKAKFYLNEKRKPFTEVEIGNGKGIDKHTLANTILLYYDQLMQPVEKITIKIEKEEP